MCTYRPESCIPSNRTNGDQQALADVGNPPNRTGNSSRGQQLSLYIKQSEPQGLTDSFVLKHTTDKPLARYLSFKRGFAAADHNSPQVCRVVDPTENINPQVVPRQIVQQPHSSTQCHTLFYCEDCCEIIGLTPPL